MSYHRTLLLVLLMGTSVLLRAQYNLVPNYSFEDINACPIGISGFSWSSDPYVQLWLAGTGGSSDYFNACATGSYVDVPSNLFSTDQPAHTGDAYAGFWTDIYDNNTDIYREYVQVQLNAPLEAGTCYYVEFWSAPATQSDVGMGHATTDAIGAYFSSTKVGDPFSYAVLDVTPQVDNNGTGNYIDPPGDWTKICGYFTAEGGEDWVCIGNFHSDDETDVVAYTGGTLSPTPLVYLFLDDVFVTPVDSLAASMLNDTVVCAPVVLDGLPCGDSYLWSTGETTPSITVFETGEYWVQVNTDCGVLEDSAYVLFVTDSTYTSDSLIQICPSDLPITLNASPAYDYYAWNTGETTENISINAAGTYYVTGYAGCATFIDSFTVQTIDPVGVLPDLGNDTLVCAPPGWEITYTAPPGYLHYTWNTGATVQSITVNDPGTYWVTVESACEEYSDTVVVSDDPYFLAQADLGDDQVLCPPAGISMIQLSNAEPLPDYEWSTGQNTPSITVSQPGWYWLTSQTLCRTLVDSVLIYYCDAVGMPDAFSPNGDGVNDYFFPLIVDPANILSLNIYNRWGQLIYSGSGSTAAWDGTYQNEPQPVGVYVYVLTYLQDGALKSLKGNLTLIR